MLSRWFTLTIFIFCLTIVHSNSINLLQEGMPHTSEINEADFHEEAITLVAKANANFCKDLFKALKMEGNLVMSSFSIGTALAMSLNGASGNTALQIRQGLGLHESRLFKEGYRNALLKIDGAHKLHSANR